MLKKEINLTTGEEAVTEFSAEELLSLEVATEADRLHQENVFNTLPYTERRARMYPPIADYIDGVVKGDQAQIDAYVAACLAVKAAYPKE